MSPTRRRGRINHPFWSFLPVLALNAFLGLPVYWFALFVAYYTELICDETGDCREYAIGWPNHVCFLIPIAIFAVICGLIVLFSAAWEPEAMVGQLFAFGILTSLALNATAVAIGSIVSALNKNQHSVSADFSTTTDVMLATALFGFAAVCALMAEAVRHPQLRQPRR